MTSAAPFDCSSVASIPHVITEQRERKECDDMCRALIVFEKSTILFISRQILRGGLLITPSKMSKMLVSNNPA
jgi:hypothetical protein